ncbi:MAG: hypothetical protein IPL38_06590 [Rhodobacter sp.]|nr:hypothetical protein [Rhodobacter sp.]MBK8439180.1 hypothetical protein [Rhodobacter sp.]
MTLLVLGVALWWVAHLFKRLAPGPRVRLGDPGKGLVALALVGAVVLMVLGFRAAGFVELWYPPGWLVHVNNLLMMLSVFLFAADGMRAPVIGRMRHPQLIGFKTWAVAHLLVNGDLASVVLFGGLLAWAVVEVIVINRAQPVWTPKPVRPGANVKAVAATIFAVVGIMLIHNWLGVKPWGG